MRRASLALVLLVALAAPCVASATPPPPTVKVPRAAIDSLLDRFVADVLRGGDLRAGKALVAGYESVGAVQRYPAKGTHFRGWTVNYSYPGDVGFDILLQPTKRSLGAWSFRAEAQKLGGHWKIVSWAPVATFAPVGKPAKVVGPNDFQPMTGRQSVSHSSVWLLIPLGVLGAVVAGALAFALTRWARTRARVREIERRLAA